MPASRLLTPEESGELRMLTVRIGWNQLDRDWRKLIECSPTGCFGIEKNGRIVSTSTAIVTPGGIGWIGMIITHPKHRGKGYGTQLLREAVDYLDGQVDTIKLDATAAGEPLYCKLGFLDEQPIERWGRNASPLPDLQLPPGSYPGTLYHPPIPIHDRQETDHAFAAGRAGQFAWYFGPCYADSEAAARQAVPAILSRHCHVPVVWDLFPNHPAAAIARELGFAPLRRLKRMYRGKFQPTPPDVYAISGFEWGD